ncbi:MAG: hypothetical protein MUF45_10350 [Spirosomaceae bacterium]|jgi:hypothetical protein|nr:hypothetical protein [Spirosomataceae bacterium]
MIKQILLTTDFSIASENAIRCAIKTFENINCHFTLFNCSEEDSKERSEFYLNKFREDLEWNYSNLHTFSSLFLDKSIDESLAYLKKNFIFQIVVVGTSGLGNNQYLGSFAKKIYREFKTASLFIPHHSKVKTIKKAQIIIEANENLNIMRLMNFRNYLETQEIEASILLVSKNYQEQKNVEKGILKDIKHLFGSVSTKIETCSNYIDGICECVLTSQPDIFVLILKEKLQNTFYERVTNQLIRNFHSAPVLNIPSLQVSEKNTIIREDKTQYAF